MSILIKGAEIPKTCEECQSTLGLFAKECPLFAEFPKEFDYDPEIGNNRRYANCPLVEVPEPHGRLIDADKMVQFLHHQGCDCCKTPNSDECFACGEPFAEAVTDLQPTVIEAEGQEHE